MELSAGLNPGDRISEYVLVEQIGAGSFGAVWKAHHHVWTSQLVAVKVAHDPQLARALAKEGAVVHGLSHPNIVRAIGMDPYGDPPYLVLEFVDGTDLARRIAAGPVPVAQAIEIFRQIMVALDFAHGQGVVHRDVKPPNVLITGGAGLPVVKVTDFGLGLAQIDGKVSILRSSIGASDANREMAGTLAYMAPEVRDGGKAEPRSDLFSAGIVLFEMVTGKLPVGRELPSDMARDCPKWVDDLFEKCYARIERRWPSARAILDEIEARQRPGARVPTAPAGPKVAPSTTVFINATSAAQPVADGPRRCPKCDELAEKDDQFCIHCGTQLVQHVRRCGKCGAWPNLTDVFCIFCGTRLPEAPRHAG